MTGDSSNLGSKETRPPLNDMTNVPNKRGISSILGDLLSKSGDESGKNVVPEGSGVKFSKRLCLVVEDLVKETSRPSNSNEGSSMDDKNSTGDSPVNGDSEHIEHVDGTESREVKNVSDAVDLGPQSAKADDGDAAVENVGGDCKVLKDGCISSGSVQTSLQLSEKDYGQESNMASNANQSGVTGEGLGRSVFSSNTESCDRPVKGEKNTTEGQCSQNSHSFRSFEMSRCSTLERKGNMNHSEGVDLLKSCSCSFCLKAAYIWSDLHYQDIKGRLSVLKKSQKEASNLIQKNVRGKPIDLHGLPNSNSLKLESDLMAQWRSLFLSMGDILSRESNHLQSSFVTMKDLRENCKMDLERTTGAPQHES